MKIAQSSDICVFRTRIFAVLLVVFASSAFFKVQASENELQIATTKADQTYTTVYLIRHAEKHLNQEQDPDLTDKGVLRAIHWADVFAYQTLDAVFSTETKRTLNTAIPIAYSQGLQVDLMEPVPADISALVSNHQGQTILMVGHSNTLPSLVNALMGEERYLDLDESNYSTLFIVILHGDSATAQQLKISL